MQASLSEDAEGECGESAAPGDDEEDLAGVRCQSISCGHVLCRVTLFVRCRRPGAPTVVLVHARTEIEECRSKAAPYPTCAVHRSCIHGVIDLQLLHQC